MTRTGIIAPMPVEAAHLVPPGADQQRGENGSVIYRWQTAGSRICLARSGIGMRRAAQAARYLVEECRVERIIVSGVAGGLSPELRTGALVLPQSVRAYNHVSKAGLIPEGPLEHELAGPLLPVDPELRQAAAAFCESGYCGDVLISVRGLVTSPELLGWFRDGLQASAVDMESAAVAEVCAAAGVPFVVVRALSDHAPELARWDWAGLGRARQRGKAAEVCHLWRHPRLAVRLRAMKHDVDRGAAEAARVVGKMLDF